MSAIEAKIIFIGPPVPPGPKSGGDIDPPHSPVAPPMYVGIQTLYQTTNI